MKFKQNKRAVSIGITVALVIILVLLIILNPKETKEPSLSTDPTIGTYLPDSALPTPTNPRPEEPEYESPYDPNENCCCVMIPIYQSELNIFGMTVTAPSSPDSTYLTEINVEDTVTISLSKQPDNIDMNKLSVIGFLHNDFPDPYITSVENLPEPLFSAPFHESDGRWNAQFMIGYGYELGAFIDVIFVYDNQIVYFTMFMVTEGDGTSEEYWEHYFPGASIGNFTITCDKVVYNYCFFVKEGATLETWVRSRTNVDEWEMYPTYLANQEKTWFIPIEQCNIQLQDGINFTATKDKPAEPEPFTFDDTNPEYLVSYIGATKDVVISEFGEPNSQEAMGSTTKILYEQAAFYISDNLVVQIDVIDHSVVTINGLDTNPTNSDSIENTLNSLGIEIPKYKWITDVPSSYYCVKLPITHNNWTVCYVWESKEQFVPSEMNFTKIVIHSGEDYYY
jgi:hypothetical protein